MLIKLEITRLLVGIILEQDLNGLLIIQRMATQLMQQVAPNVEGRGMKQW